MWKTFISSMICLTSVSASAAPEPDGVQSPVDVVGGYEVGSWYHRTDDPNYLDILYRLTKDSAENIETFNMVGAVNAGVEGVLPILSEFNVYASRSQRYRPSGDSTTTVLRSYTNVPSIRIYQSKRRQHPLDLENVTVQIVRHVRQIPFLGTWTDTILFTFPTEATRNSDGNLTAELNWIQFDEESFDQIEGSWKESCDISIDDEDLFLNDNADLYGSWHLAEREGGETELTYVNLIDPGFAGRQLKGELVRRMMPEMPKSIVVVREALGLISPDTMADTGH